MKPSPSGLAVRTTAHHKHTGKVCANVAEEQDRRVVNAEVGLGVEDVHEQMLDRRDEVAAQKSRAKIASGLLGRVQLRELSRENSQLTTICMEESTKQLEV